MSKPGSLAILIAVSVVILFILILFFWFIKLPQYSGQDDSSQNLLQRVFRVKRIDRAGEEESEGIGQTSSSKKIKSDAVNQKTNSKNDLSQNSSNSSLKTQANSTYSAEEKSSIQTSFPLTVLGNQYGKKSYETSLSKEAQKQEREIATARDVQMKPLFPQSSANSSTSSTSDYQKPFTLLTKLFSVFFEVPEYDQTEEDFVIPTLTPAPQPTTPLPPPGLLKGKIGVYILSQYSAGAQKIVSAKPRIIKVMDPHINPTLQAALDFRRLNPTGISVLRIYLGTSGFRFTLIQDPVLSANVFYLTIVQPALTMLGQNIELFNYIETPNELDNTPGWESTVNTAWLNSFWKELISLYRSRGLKTCIGSIPVGNPPGGYAEIKNNLAPFLPALQELNRNQGTFCYHAYTLNYTTDLGQEIQTSLRYRQIHQAISELDGSLASLPFILSEAGVDRNGDPKTSGWNVRGSLSDYANWLSWFNSQINQDPYVLGATLYQIGDSHWSSFNLEPIADWISQSL